MVAYLPTSIRCNQSVWIQYGPGIVTNVFPKLGQAYTFNSEVFTMNFFGHTNHKQFTGIGLRKLSMKRIQCKTSLCGAAKQLTQNYGLVSVMLTSKPKKEQQVRRNNHPFRSWT